MKNLGPLATEHFTALYNDSLRSCRLPSIWKTSLVIPNNKPGKDLSQGTSYRPISLLCQAAKVLEALILPSINEFLAPAKDQHGFRPRYSTASALLHITTDILTGFSQWKPPHLTVCVAIDLTAAFDTVSHDTLISKIVGLSQPPAITRWLSCYLIGRQAATSLRGTKSSTRIVHTGVTQGSKLSPSLFNYCIDDMPRPTPSDSSFKKIQTAQNAALRTLTGAHKKASIDYVHQESLTLRVNDHSDILSAQYLVN